jgi:hypothetical protein
MIERWLNMYLGIIYASFALLSIVDAIAIAISAFGTQGPTGWGIWLGRRLLWLFLWPLAWPLYLHMYGQEYTRRVSSWTKHGRRPPDRR